MNSHIYDVAVVGAGTAGLSAIAEIQKSTQNFVLINQGAYGTTCARVGCMPSKALIQVANNFHQRKGFSGVGIQGSKNLKVNSSEVMTHVRRLRDRFMKDLLEETFRLGQKNIQGSPLFLDPTTLKVGKRIIRAKRIILATGTSPEFPAEWKAFSDQIVTTDNLFDLEELPVSVAAIGLGPIGLEIGQALSRLGVKVRGLGRSKALASITDPVVNAFAKKLIESEFPLSLGGEAKVSATKGNLKITLGNKSYRVEKILASLGRRPNLDGLGLKNIGALFDQNGNPKFNKQTLQMSGLPIYLAGDVDQYRTVLHEAADEGRIAGINSVKRRPVSFERKVPLRITFCEPNIVAVGQCYSDLDRLGHDFFVGRADLTEGRAIILGQRGVLRIYGSRSGRILGAEMVAPRGEHLGHLIACMIHQKMKVTDALKIPIYHPVMEEGLRDALEDLSEKLAQR